MVRRALPMGEVKRAEPLRTAHALLTIKSVNRAALEARDGFADAGSAIAIADVAADLGGRRLHALESVLHGLRPQSRPEKPHAGGAAAGLPEIPAGAAGFRVFRPGWSAGELRAESLRAPKLP